jgi:hypothetical protein
MIIPHTDRKSDIDDLAIESVDEPCQAIAPELVPKAPMTVHERSASAIGKPED